ncbi:LAQU0S16e00386g1_1 [Lachancea quebecensis]|uniref:LAQU0S16e00386g1_1 n=1 Tax=Lachancea quebecensis TaxID=1654605 RepID=A0A0P1KYD0_9SACH|nr:LAQU0S16e00386g1_1 [Lachancea quebecensis]
MALWRRRLAIGCFYLAQVICIATGLRYDSYWALLVAPWVLGYSFTALGLITSDFLTPNLSIISKQVLHISDRVSGMTLLALGNSIPDITSTYQSMRSGATPLALGELLGAVVFLLTVVVGAMPFVRTIEFGNLDPECELDPLIPVEGSATLCYNRTRFMKDLVLFAVLIFLSLFFLYDGKLVFWECVLMVSIYVGYVIYQLYFEANEPVPSVLVLPEANEAIIASSEMNQQLNPRDEAQFLRELEHRKANLSCKIRRRLRSNYSVYMKMPLNDILNVWDNESAFETAVSHPKITKCVSHQDLRAELNIIRPSSPSHNQEPIHSRDGGEETSISDTDHGLLKPPIRTNSRSVSADYLLYLDNHLQSSDNSLMESVSSNEQIDTDTNELQPLESKSELLESHEKPIIQSVLYNYWYNEKACHGWVEIVTLLVITPVLLVLRFLIPSPDNLFDRRQNKGKITCIQVLVAPLMIDYFITGSWHPWNALIILATTLLFYYLRSRAMQDLVIRFVSVLAFLLSVSTISFIVKNVVDVLRQSAAALNVSEAMLGLTIFAWGNSVGDLATTVTFTKMGVLDVALGACFGGPLLYFLFGIGLDGILVILLKKEHHKSSVWFRHIDFEVNALLIVSCLTLLATFAVYLIVIPLNNWRVDRSVGITLLALYGVATALNIYFELY